MNLQGLSLVNNLSFSLGGLVLDLCTFSVFGHILLKFIIFVIRVYFVGLRVLVDNLFSKFGI